MNSRTPLTFILVAVLAGFVRGQDVRIFPQASFSPEPDTFGPTVVPNLLADVNGDGLVDAVIVSHAGFLYGEDIPRQLLVRLGHGNGTFDAPIAKDVLNTGYTEAVLAGDLNGDGLDDVVLPHAEWPSAGPEGSLQAFISMGGSLSPVVTTSLPGTIGTSILVDMDGDGLADLVGHGSIPGPAVGLVVARSLGTGAFEVTAEAPVQDSFFSDIAVADFDLDGQLDVASDALAYASPHAVAVYRGTGDGALDPVPVLSPAQPSFLSAGDLDDDGVPDLAETSDVVIYVMHGHGDATFTETEKLPVPVEPYGAASAIGDLNGDGRADVALVFSGDTSEEAPGFAVFLNDGVGGLLPGTFIDAAGGDSVRIADVDGDGLADVVIDDEIVSGRGDGSFVTRKGIDLAGAAPAVVVTSDLNQDGLPDLACTLNATQAALAVALGHGDGSFDEAVRLDPFSQATLLVPADLNGDGFPDLVVQSGPLYAATSACWFNDGSGTHFPSSAPAFASSATSIAVADLDADGNLDLVATQTLKPDLLVRLGDGQGHFSPAPNALTIEVPTDVAAADMDLDGTTDLVATAPETASIAILRGLGAATFAIPQMVPADAQVETLQIIDLNDDGLPDLAAAAPQAASVQVVFAKLIGGFSAPVTCPLPGSPTDLQVADVTHDGRPDLITVQKSSGQISCLRNLGGNAFAPSQEYAPGGKPFSLAIGNLDGDARPDIAVACKEDHAIEVLANVLLDFPNLGYQHGASFVTPHLATTGAPKPDTTVSFTATGAPPQSLGALFLGLQFAPTPFAGGTLVPSPDVMVPMQAGATLSGRWPDLPPGTTVYGQAWFSSGTDVAATNAILAISQ